MADHLDLPANWYGHRARVGGSRYRFRLWCDQLESRDATGSIVSGVVAAAFGAPLSDSMSELARLIGDWAFLDGAARTSPPAGPVAPSADESPRKLTRYDTWLEPDLLFAEERPERGIRVTAPTAPANPARGAFGDLLGEQPHLSGPNNFGPFPSFVGVRAAAVFAPESPQSPRSVVNGAATVVARQDSETLPFGVRIGVHEAEPVEIPNNPPHAVADSITVSEDGSIVFNPSFNDTDPDGDPLWVKFVEGETANGRTYWEEGGNIRYIPDPDFHGEDSFGYLVTDGLDQYEGTVTVTVTPTNDPVYAFDDFWGFTRASLDEVPPGQTAWVTSDASIGGNDYDPDGAFWIVPGIITVTGANGKSAGFVDLSENGTFYWEMPREFFGLGSFEYGVTDKSGTTATAKVWVFAGDPGSPSSPPPPQPPPLTPPTADIYVIGDDPLEAGSVMANDTDKGIAILGGRPLGFSGRITDFDNDGTFKYLPGVSAADQTFGYDVYTLAGGYAGGVEVTLSKVNLTLHHGQNGKSVRELNERLAVAGGNPLIPAFKATGAFTVANLNDSNANGKVDSVLEEREMINDPQFPGSGEVDLMRLDVTAPADSMVTLTVSPGAVNSVRLWRTSLKGGGDPVLDANGMGIGKSSSVDVAPGTYWVELAGVSGAIGDVKIEGKLGQATDTVEATAIWTKHNPAQTHQWPDGHFMANGEKALPAEADAEPLREMFTKNGSQLGLVDKVPQDKIDPISYRTSNAELAKFLMLPGGLTPYVSLGIVFIDASRSIDGRSAFNGKESIYPEPYPQPYWLDIASDDNKGDNDEDNDLVYFNSGVLQSTNYVFGYDQPGPGSWHAKADGVYLDPGTATSKVIDTWHRYNFFDFVRIQIGTRFVPGPPPPGTLVKGSRASVFYAWHSLLHLRPEQPPGQPWTLERYGEPPLSKDQENRIGMGHVDATKAGG